MIGVNDSKWSWIQILRTPKHSVRKHRSIGVSKHLFLLWHWTATQFNLQNTEYDLWRHQSDLHGHCGPPPISRIYGANDQIQHYTASPPEPVALIFQCATWTKAATSPGLAYRDTKREGQTKANSALLQVKSLRSILTSIYTSQHYCL